MASNKLTQCYELYRGQIQHEDLLLNQRVTWIVMSQAFLLSTYVFLLNSPAFYASAANGDPQPLPGCENVFFNISAFVGAIQLLRHVFQTVGLFSSIATCISSMAAVLAVRRLVGLYGRHLIAVEKDQHGGDLRESHRHLSRAEVAVVVKRIHAREGLPPLVTRRLYSMMGLTASVFFGPVFAGAWIVLIFPLQRISTAMTFVLAPALLLLLGALLYKLSGRAPVGNGLIEKPDEA